MFILIIIGVFKIVFCDLCIFLVLLNIIKNKLKFLYFKICYESINCFFLNVRICKNCKYNIYFKYIGLNIFLKGEINEFLVDID